MAKPKGLMKAKKSARGHKLPPILPEGEILIDNYKKEWRLGKSIGSGGFGLIYIASDNTHSSSSHAKYVIKMEPHCNGPLFSELHFYKNVLKEKEIKEWINRKRLTFLGLPRDISSGAHEYSGTKYRFLVMERFGEDLQKLLDKRKGIFDLQTVYGVGINVINALEYIHSKGYIHGDIKAANLMTSMDKNKESEVYLVDFGLARRYMTNGIHKEDIDDKRKAHDGTPEFTSRDAHRGVASRRGDLEILAYNMLYWLCGHLPWDSLSDKVHIHNEKNEYMQNISKLMTTCFPSGSPKGINDFFDYVANLKFDEEPDYDRCRSFLNTSSGYYGSKDDVIFASSSARKFEKKITSKPENFQFSHQSPKNILLNDHDHYSNYNKVSMYDSSSDSSASTSVSSNRSFGTRTRRKAVKKYSDSSKCISAKVNDGSLCDIDSTSESSIKSVSSNHNFTFKTPGKAPKMSSSSAGIETFDFGSNPTPEMIEVYKNKVKKESDLTKVKGKTKISKSQQMEICSQPRTKRSSKGSQQITINLQIPKNCKVKEFKVVMENDSIWDSSESS